MTLYIQPYPYRHLAPRYVPTACTPDYNQRLAVNIRNEDDAYLLSALVPGLNKDDVNIQILEDVVRIEGEFKTDEAEYLMNELPSGSFQRSLRLPTAVDANKAEAKINDGVLTLRLPKVETALPKKIKITAK